MHRAVERAHVAGQGDAVEREQDVARLRAGARGGRRGRFIPRDEHDLVPRPPVVKSGCFLDFGNFFGRQPVKRGSRGNRHQVELEPGRPARRRHQPSHSIVQRVPHIVRRHHDGLGLVQPARKPGVGRLAAGKQRADDAAGRVEARAAAGTAGRLHEGL